jgi:hypothetical protein
MLKLEDGDMRLTATVPDDDRLAVGKRITLKYKAGDGQAAEREWTIVTIYNVPEPNRGWKNNI